MDDTKELILRAHNGDKAARDKLVLENIGLVYSVSRRFAGRGYELEDINQIGTIGLIKAIDKFDDSFDVRFSTYAVPMIAGEIKRFLRDDGMLKVSRSLKENGYRIKKASDKLVSQNGREATIEELAAATELSVEDVVMALEANTDVESIYRTIYQNDGNEVYLVDKLSGSSVRALLSAEGVQRTAAHIRAQVHIQKIPLDLIAGYALVASVLDEIIQVLLRKRRWNGKVHMRREQQAFVGWFHRHHLHESIQKL